MPVPIKGRRRRSPWPYDLVITAIATMTAANDNHGFRLVRSKKDSPLVVITPVPTKGPETNLDFGAQDPEIEQSWVWNDFVYGMGQKVQSEEFGRNDKRYYYSLGVDCAYGGQFIPGPALTTGTPATVDSTNGISQFYELGSNLYAVNGRYILYWDTTLTPDNFSVSKDTGVGKAAKHAIVAKQNQSGSTAYALVAMGDSDNFWYHDGAAVTTTWAQHASLKALCWEIEGHELLRAHDVSRIEKCDLANDFLTAGNWTANNWRAGDYKYPIQRLKTNAAGTLVALKQDSIHTILPDGTDKTLYPGVNITPSTTNGLVAEVWENDLYTVYNDRMYKIGPNLELLPIGPERLTENDSDVRGAITQCAGTPYRLYAGLYNRDTANTYTMGLGAWPRTGDGEPHRIDVWHGSLTAGVASKYVTAMYVSTAGSFGAPSGHRLLWLGYSNGTWANFILPCVPNPKACSSTTFVSTGSLVPSLWHGGYPANPKLLRGYTVSGTVAHNLEVAVTDNDFGGAGDQGLTAFTAVPAARQDIHWGTVKPTRVLLQQSWSNITGIISGVGLHYQVKNTPQRIYEFAIWAEDGLLKLDGSRLSRGAARTRDICRMLREEAGTVYVTWPDESSEYCTVTAMEETIGWDDRSKSWHSAIRLRLVTTEPGTSSEVGSPYTL